MTTVGPVRNPSAVTEGRQAVPSMGDLAALGRTLFLILFFTGVIVLSAMALPAVCLAVIALIEWLA